MNGIITKDKSQRNPLTASIFSIFIHASISQIAVKCIGHSAGEVSAAYAAGILSLEEATNLVYIRSKEQQSLAGCGRMLAVSMGLAEAHEVIGARLDEVEVACINSPDAIVLAGSEDTLKSIKSSLPTEFRSSFIPGNVAFHCFRVEPILPSLRKKLAFLDRTFNTDPTCAFISTVTGEACTQLGSE